MSSADTATSLVSEQRTQSESDTSAVEQDQHSIHDFYLFILRAKPTIDDESMSKLIAARFGTFHFSGSFHSTVNTLWKICCNRKMDERTRFMAASHLEHALSVFWTVMVSSGVDKYNEFYDMVFARFRTESSETTRFFLGKIIGCIVTMRRDKWPAFTRFVKESAASKDRTVLQALFYVCSRAPLLLWDSPEIRHRIARALSSSRSTSDLLRSALGAMLNLLEHSHGEDVAAWALNQFTPELFERCEAVIVGDLKIDNNVMDVMIALHPKTERGTVLSNSIQRLCRTYMSKYCLRLLETVAELTQCHEFSVLVRASVIYLDKLSDQAVEAIVSMCLLGIGMEMETTWSEQHRHKTKDPEMSLARLFTNLETNRAEVAMIEASRPLLHHEHWTMRAAALRGLHIYAETCSEDIAATLVNCATRGIKDMDSRVRYCASLLLRSVVEWHRHDLNQLFDFDYDNTLLALLPFVGDENDPRLARATLDALEAVMWSTKDEVLTTYYDLLYPRLLGVLLTPLVQDLRPRALQALHCFVNVEQFERDFPEVLRAYVDGNSRYFISPNTISKEEEGELSCFGCNEVRPEVIIRKVCERDICDSCSCSPHWCMKCMARVVLGGLESHHRSMKARCPFCRLWFCAEDLHFVREREE